MIELHHRVARHFPRLQDLGERLQVMHRQLNDRNRKVLDHSREFYIMLDMLRDIGHYLK